MDVRVEREEAVARLMPNHLEAVEELGGSAGSFWLSEQVHGNEVAVVSGESSEGPVSGADGLATSDPSVILGVHVADCGALYLGDPVNKAVAVLHSGKVGTEKNILGRGVDVMVSSFGSDPSDLVVVLAPCIRPPAYEVDFAATIKRQAYEAGVRDENFHDCGICTTSDPERYYSYRAEKGKTGRMIALMGCEN